MPKTFRELTPERRLIILCSRGVLSQDHIQEINEILEEVVDWKEIIYQGVTHRVLNMMYFHLIRLKLTDKVEKEVLKLFKSETKVYRVRNKVYFNEMKEICNKFKEADIRAAVLKGNYLAANVYPSIETRTFNDLDFLFDIKDAEKITAILESLDYKQGHSNDETGQVTPFNRKEKIFHQMNTIELPEFRKKTDNEFASTIEVDMNMSVLWKGNCPCEISTSELLDRAIEVDIFGGNAFILDHEDFLVQLACHLYKEAALLSWITDLRDLKIYKFADILLFVEKFADDIKWNKLITFCKKVGCEKIVYYVFYYVNLIYQEVIPQQVMNELEPSDLEYLDEYGVENEKPSKWQYDFFTRMFETSRVLEVSDEALAKKNSFWEKKNKLK